MLSLVTPGFPILFLEVNGSYDCCSIASSLREYTNELKLLSRNEPEEARDAFCEPGHYNLANFNFTHLQNVLRKDGITPYWIHPIIVGLLCYEPHCNIEKIYRRISAALGHDILEEIAGITPSGYSRILNEFPNEPIVLEAALFLTAPDLTFLEPQIAGEFSKEELRLFGFKAQLQNIKTSLFFEDLVTVALADKIANMSDLEFITSDPLLSDQAKREKISNLLTQYTFLIEDLIPFASLRMQEMWRSIVYDLDSNLGISPDRVKLKTLRKSYYLSLHSIEKHLKSFNSLILSQN